MKIIVKSLFAAIALMAIVVSCGKEPSQPTVVCPTGAVDLGLSVYWATCNLGASKPEDHGGYYQWAGLNDVADKSIYLDWSNCPFHTGSSYSSGWTKYVPSGKSSY